MSGNSYSHGGRYGMRVASRLQLKLYCVSGDQRCVFSLDRFLCIVEEALVLQWRCSSPDIFVCWNVIPAVPSSKDSHGHTA